MMNGLRKWLLMLALLAGPGLWVGCDANEGPAERAAEDFGEGAEEIGEEIDDAVDEIDRELEVETDR